MTGDMYEGVISGNVSFVKVEGVYSFKIDERLELRYNVKTGEYLAIDVSVFGYITQLNITNRINLKEFVNNLVDECDQFVDSVNQREERRRLLILKDIETKLGL